MPKELIVRNTTRGEPDNELTVQWSAEGMNVQVAVKVYGEVTSATGESLGKDPVLYSDTLTRPDINKLIKTLRRARDLVYGKDE